MLVRARCVKQEVLLHFAKHSLSHALNTSIKHGVVGASWRWFNVGGWWLEPSQRTRYLEEANWKSVSARRNEETTAHRSLTTWSWSISSTWQRSTWWNWRFWVVVCDGRFECVMRREKGTLTYKCIAEAISFNVKNQGAAVLCAGPSEVLSKRAQHLWLKLWVRRDFCPF